MGAWRESEIRENKLFKAVIMLHCYLKKHTAPFEKKLAWFGVFGIAVLASVPLFVDYMIAGEVTAFYWQRIEELAQRGSLPSYCETFLAFPVLMRLIGFDMVASYNTYVFAVNLATALIAYLSFKGCFRDGRIGVVGSLLYTLAPYRVYTIYDRGAAGEYAAMAFLPLLVYGFYQIFTNDVRRKGHWRGLLVLVLGAFPISLWQLVPFPDMMLSGQYDFSESFGSAVQNRGILPAHIFDTMQAAGSNSHFYERGLLDTAPVGIGMAVLLGTGAFWLARDICRDKRDEKQDRAAVVAFALGMAALLASTIYFPWDAIRSWNGVAASLVSMLQFPTRLTIVAAACMTFVSCAGAAFVLRCGNRFWKNAFFVIVCGAAVVFSLYQTNDILMKKSEQVRQYSVEDMGDASDFPCKWGKFFV